MVWRSGGRGEVIPRALDGEGGLTLSEETFPTAHWLIVEMFRGLSTRIGLDGVGLYGARVGELFKRSSGESLNHLVTHQRLPVTTG